MKSAVKRDCFSRAFFPCNFKWMLIQIVDMNFTLKSALAVIKRDVGIVFCCLDIKELNGNQKVLVRIKVKWEQIDYKILL